MPLARNYILTAHPTPERLAERDSIPATQSDVSKTVASSNSSGKIARFRNNRLRNAG
jgi:hypothetical protein